MGSEPRRIQRRRVKGWRMSDGAVYVGRPTMWGNPFRIGWTGWIPAADCATTGRWDKTAHPPLTATEAVEAFRRTLLWHIRNPNYAATLRSALGGKDLACWCPLDQPCHADVLLKIANGGEP